MDSVWTFINVATGRFISVEEVPWGTPPAAGDVVDIRVNDPPEGRLRALVRLTGTVVTVRHVLRTTYRGDRAVREREARISLHVETLEATPSPGDTP